MEVTETAFFVRTGDSCHLRWFTPAVEVDLCGHATLASAFVLFSAYRKNCYVLESCVPDWRGHSSIIKTSDSPFQPPPYFIHLGDFADGQAQCFATLNAAGNVIARRFQRLQRLHQGWQYLGPEMTPRPQVHLDKSIDGSKHDEDQRRQQYFVLGWPVELH